MGAQSVSKDKEISVDRGNTYLMKCNECERDVRLRSEHKVKSEQLDKLQVRMLCWPCFDKRMKSKA